MMKRLALLILAVLWFMPHANAQSLTKICFPTNLTASGGRVSCQDVTANNPLPITGVNINVGSLTISGSNTVALNSSNSSIGFVTMINSAAAPALVSLINNIGVNGPVTVSLVNIPGASGPVTVTCTNCGASSFTTQPSLVTIANSAGLPAIVSMVNIPSASGPMAVTCTNCGAASFTTQPSLVTIANSASLPAIVSLVNIPNPLNVSLINVPGTLTMVNIVGAAQFGGANQITANNMLTAINKLKDGPGQLFKLYCYNPNSSVAYIQVFNLTPTSVQQWLSTGLNTQGGLPNSYAIPGTTAAGFVMNPIPDQYTKAISAISTLTSTGVLPPSTGLDCNFSIN